MTMTRGLIGLAMAIALLTQPSARSGAPQDKSRPTSYQLISDALTAGRITEESAYKYRVFAAFGHPGLPEQYRGIDSLVTEVPRSVFAVGPKLRTFSPQTRAELMPFFLPPSAPGSWVALSAAPDVPREPMPVPGDDPVDDTSVTPVSERPSTIWFTKLAAGGAVKVWAQLHHRGDSAKAEKIADEITATIWPALTRVLGRPKSDMQYMLNSGGPELDIFLVRPSFTPADSARNVQRYGRSAPWRGVTMHTDTTTWPCKEAAFFILLNSVNPVGSATSKGLLQDVAHEITHAITGAKPLQGACEDYDWMSEATATWAEHKAYPKAQTEHGPAQGFLADVSLSLDERTPGDFDSHAYDSYLFPFYLMLTGKEAAIPAIWQAFATQAQLAGVNAGLKSQGLKFDEVFPKFAQYNLNQADQEEYRKRDQLPFSAEIQEKHDVTVTGTTDYEYGIPLSIKHLATKYAHFKFDQKVRTITFENTLAPIPFAAVWVVPNVLGTWEDPIELTRTGQRTWCRDMPTQDVEELIFVFTNNEWQDPRKLVAPASNTLPTVRAFPGDCGRGWTGTSELTNTISSTNPAVTIVETVRTTMRFAVDSSFILPGEPREYYKTVGDSISWQVNVTGACSGSASGKVPIANRTDDHVAVLRIWSEDRRLHHSGSNGPWPGDIPYYTVTCANGERAQMALLSALGFFATDSDKDHLEPDGKSFSGNFQNQPAPGMTVHHRYSFRCARNC